jgi:hypothetical protein
MLNYPIQRPNHCVLDITSKKQKTCCLPLVFNSFDLVDVVVVIFVLIVTDDEYSFFVATKSKVKVSDKINITKDNSMRIIVHRLI